jgi:hypothetical protein
MALDPMAMEGEQLGGARKSSEENQEVARATFGSSCLLLGP